MTREEMKLTLAYNGSDDLYYMRAGYIYGGTKTVVTPVIMESIPEGDYIEPMIGLTHKEAQNLANALAQAGVFASAGNASQDGRNSRDEPERTFPESTVRAMRSHIRDLRKLLFGEDK